MREEGSSITQKNEREANIFISRAMLVVIGVIFAFCQGQWHYWHYRILH